MPLAISYFAWVRERMGRSEEMLDVADNVHSIADLIGWLAARDAAGSAAFGEPARIRAALDGVMVPLDAPLGDARTLALFPPVTGG